ncbi:MAG: hypothetical protein U0172_04500 [Nitrospiraceae bacterium]
MLRQSVYESGLTSVRLESDPDSVANTHPATLTPTEVGTLLRGVRTWERRNVLHRLWAGAADKRRAFRDDEIAILAPAIAKAFALAGQSDRIYFHISRATEHGQEETTTGWLAIREQLLAIGLNEVHDQHGPGPDISKYDRQMPNVPEASTLFDATFEPEDFLVATRSSGGIFSPTQQEELTIRYKEALKVLPIQPGLSSLDSEHSGQGEGDRSKLLTAWSTTHASVVCFPTVCADSSVLLHGSTTTPLTFDVTRTRRL